MDGQTNDQTDNNSDDYFNEFPFEVYWFDNV